MRDVLKSWLELSVMRRTPRSSGLIVLASGRCAGCRRWLGSDQWRQTLDIYVVDVEGGNATLFVSPSGESLLIDTGNAGAAAVRDAEPHHGRLPKTPA